MGAPGRTLTLEYAGQGIRINTVAPGAIATPINREWLEDPKKKAEVEGHTPIGRAGRPEEIAAVFAFLASEEAVYITGQTVYVDGGLTLLRRLQDAVVFGELRACSRVPVRRPRWSWGFIQTD